MSPSEKFLSILCVILTITCFQQAYSQDKIPWLDDYAGEMLIGSDTYRYNFTNIEGNDCNPRIEELVTDKKGSTKTRSWVFYLSDINPSEISFKAKGKSLDISMETHRSQKFITYYEDGEIQGFTEKIGISMNELDLTRSFLETIKEKIANCKETQVSWENRDQAFTWLVNNIAEATDKEIKWDQKFAKGDRNYMVDFQANSTNKKGEHKMYGYTFDLNDINPSAINLKISGKSLMVELPISEGKRYIMVQSPAGTVFTNKLLIYTNEIELARQIVNALSYLVTNTAPERQKWDSYNASLGFVKDNLGEVKIDDEHFTNSINFEESPSGLVKLVIEKSDSDGTSETMQYSFYLVDLMDKLQLEVSKNSITIEIETKNKREFIREIADGEVSDYTSSLSLHMADIDMARDILNAFEYAISTSEENLSEFNSISEVSSWFSEFVGTIEIEGDKFEQNLNVNEESENQLTIEKKVTEANNESIETSFILYPEDIGLDDLEIKVSGKKLIVPMETDKGRYIKEFENGKLQDFTGTANIRFIDPMVAKNFIVAIQFLKANSAVEDRTLMSVDEAKAILSENIQNIELPDDQYEQKLEFTDEGICKLSFTRVETDSKGASDEYKYEFNISDIHPGNSKFSVKGKIIAINLITAGDEKLIKPYKNGEVGDFIDDFFIYADDVLIAKKTLAVFAKLSDGCK